MLDMKFLEPVLELFRNPVSEIGLHLDKTHAAVLEGLNYNIEYESQLQQTYGKINNLLKHVQFKLCIIYSEWVKGGMRLTDDTILQLTIGINYEIEEARYHLNRLAKHVLPAFRKIPQSAFDEYKNLLTQYLYGANLVCPDRFLKGIDLSKPNGYTDEEVSNFRAGLCAPSISWNDTINYCSETIWSKEDIDGYVNNGAPVVSVHPSIPPLVNFCENIEWVFDYLKPQNFGEALPTDIQKTVLCLYRIIKEWEHVDINRLLKDEQSLTMAYKDLHTNKKQKTPYSIWRDVELTQHLTPMVVVSTSLN